MPWTQPTASDLDTYLVAAQVDALRTKAIRLGQTDPFAAARAEVLPVVRGYVAAAGTVALDADVLSVPPELKTATCVLILELMLGRLQIGLTEGQQSMVERANVQLRDAAAGRLALSKTDTPQSPANPVPPAAALAPRMGKATSTWGRDAQDGI